MIVLLKDKTILTVLRAKEVAQSFSPNDGGFVSLVEGGNTYKVVAHINKENILAIFPKDEDYIASVGADLVRNLK